jgi:hypothetical protein
MKRSRRGSSAAVLLALVLAAATALSAAMSAPETRAQATDGPHPAHIHSGTCDELGDIVQPLTDVEENTAGEVFGAKDAERVEESETDVPMTLSDILASPHAVNIHESAENIQNYIACGNIGGRVVDGELLIGLMEINGSGHHGIAKLDSDNDSTQVTVYLAEKAGEAGARPKSPPRRPRQRCRSISATSPLARTRLRFQWVALSPGRIRMPCRTPPPAISAASCSPARSLPAPASARSSIRPASSPITASFTRT